MASPLDERLDELSVTLPAGVATLSADQKLVMEELLESFRSTSASASRTCDNMKKLPTLAAIYAEGARLVHVQESIIDEIRLLRDSTRERRPRSLFLVGNFLDCKCFGALYEVKLNQGGVTHEPQQIELLSKFFDSPIYTSLSSARVFSPSKLYLLADDFSGLSHMAGRRIPPLEGYIFDIETRQLVSFSPPVTRKPRGTLVSAYGKLYYLACPPCVVYLPEPSFERYDPVQNSWEEMPSCPFYTLKLIRPEILGYAVCYGVILFSMFDFQTARHVVIAFHVSKAKWDRVKVDSDYLPFRKRAMVVDKTIYALSRGLEEIIAFSFRMDVGEDGGMSYLLSTQYKLRGLMIASPPFQICDWRTECLVHLGNLEFCHVKTGSGSNNECVGRQHLCITTFEIVEKGERHMLKNLHSTVCAIAVEDRDCLQLCYGFVPECEDFEPTEEDALSTMKQPKLEKDTNCNELTLDVEMSLYESFAMLEETSSEVDACQVTKEKRKVKTIPKPRKPKRGKMNRKY